MIQAGIAGRLDAKHRAREAGLANSRAAIRCCANAIRAVHRGEAQAADILLVEARSLLDVAESAMAAHPDVYYAGFLQDAQKEFAEARLTRALVAGAPAPPPEDLGVGDPPYLNGLAEAVGELRREVLDALRAGDVDRAERFFGVMDEIVGTLAGVDHPDGITGGLRRSTDVARSLVERTRGDLTVSIVQRDLARALGAATGTPLPPGSPPAG